MIIRNMYTCTICLLISITFDCVLHGQAVRVFKSIISFLHDEELNNDSVTEL